VSENERVGVAVAEPLPEAGTENAGENDAALSGETTEPGGGDVSAGAAAAGAGEAGSVTAAGEAGTGDGADGTGGADAGTGVALSGTELGSGEASEGSIEAGEGVTGDGEGTGETEAGEGGTGADVPGAEEEFVSARDGEGSFTVREYITTSTDFSGSETLTQINDNLIALRTHSETMIGAFTLLIATGAVLAFFYWFYRTFCRW
jgi:hypothetical protein